MKDCLLCGHDAEFYLVKVSYKDWPIYYVDLCQDHYNEFNKDVKKFILAHEEALDDSFTAWAYDEDQRYEDMRDRQLSL